jgi:uncharacterized protein YjbI with pentapeptide repeats
VSTPLTPGTTVEDRELTGIDLSGQEAGSCRFLRCRFEQVNLSETRLPGMHLGGCELIGVEAIVARWRGLDARDVTIRRSGMSGLQVEEGELRDVRFEAAKLDLASFRHARLEDVTLTDCSMPEADFYGARLRNVRFERCDLSRASFDQARVESVDLRSSTVLDLRGLAGLAGATIDPTQLVELAPGLAHAIGLRVEDA